MPTKRVPLKRRQSQRITPAALEAFRAMQSAKTGDEWWKHHSVLHRELKCKPWEWPCTKDPELVRALEEAA
jgi:hypothetical protein